MITLAKIAAAAATLLLVHFLGFAGGLVGAGGAGRRRTAALLPGAGGAAPGPPAADSPGEGSGADGAAPDPPGADSPGGGSGAATEPASAGRRRWRVPPALGWLLYLTVVVGSIVGIPWALKIVLHSSYPIAAVTGSSMWPTLTKGDIVLLEGVDGMDDLQVGDIIAFRQERGFAIHRIVKIEGAKITTRGDANLVNDPSITLDDVIGEVPTVFGRLARVPLLGHLSLLLGPLIKKDQDLRPLQAEPLARPVEDLSKKDTGRQLGPLQDLTAGGSRGNEADKPLPPGRPIKDLRQTGLAAE